MTLDPAGWTLAHDFFFEYGGAERVAQRLAEAVPDRPVWYLGGTQDVLRRAGLAHRSRRALPGWLVRPHTYHALTPAYPALVRRVPAVEGNLLVSGYAFAPGLRATGRTVVYCHSPLRQIWSGYEEYQQRLPRLQAAALRAATPSLRRQDLAAYARAHTLLCPSTAVAARISSVYGRQARVVPPPYDDTVFHLSTAERDPALLVTTARLVDASKNLSFLLRALALLPEVRLHVLGSGRDAERLARQAPPNVVFLGQRSPDEVAQELGRAAGYVQANTEDFGIATAESLACGTPVYALARGGALDLVQDGVSGRLFEDLDERGLAGLLRDGLRESWDPKRVAATVEHLRPASFVAAIRAVLAEVEAAG